jgi:hypothetical protein
MLEINSELQSKVTMKGSGKVTSKSIIEIVGTNTQLEVEHTADFSKIPVEFHQIYFDSFKASLIDSKVYDNTKEPYPMTTKEKQREWRLNRIVDIFLNSNK